MLRNKDKILVLDFDPSRGLILKWNLNPGYVNSFCRHVLIFDVGRGFNFKAFSQRYFQKIKSGDMIALAAINEEKEFYILKWREKSPLTQLQHKKLHPSLSCIQNIKKMLNLIDSRTSQMNQPIIFNIITEKSGQELKNLHSQLKTFKKEKECFLINIFSQAETSIQPNVGINWWDYGDFGQHNEKSWNNLRTYLNQISLIKIRINIECKNGVFASRKEDEWQTIEFNRISRQIHAPTSNYCQDVIQFVNEDSTTQINYILNINLQFRQLNNQICYANKKISISAMNEKVYQRTFAGRQMQYAYQIYPQFYSRKNPFHSDSIVWFKKNNQTQNF